MGRNVWEAVRGDGGISGAAGLLLERGRHQDGRIDQRQIARPRLAEMSRQPSSLAEICSGSSEGSRSIAAGVDVEIDSFQ